MHRGKFELVLHEMLGNILMCRRELMTKILKAYASQKFSMLKTSGGAALYVAETVEKVNLTTNRSFIQCVIVSFESRLRMVQGPDTQQYICTEDKRNLCVERECRRHIDSSHPLLVEKLGVSCNDFSNLTFLSRQVEILHQDYRLVINPATDSYSIQYKKKLRMKTIFRPDLLTLEALYFSHEGKVFTDAIFVATDHVTLIGLASFLDSRDLAVKTVYFEKNNTTLYQRICPDNYTRSYPFTLENEFPPDFKYEESKVGSLFFWAAWTLDARVPTLPGNGVVSASSKPIHTVEKCEEPTHRYSKFDGVPATLTFFSHHFVVTNSVCSQSFEHSLDRPVVHILQDYFFLVESNLYVSDIPVLGPDKPLPMVIIDINTTVFNATERMEIIQTLRKHLRYYLYDYYIFFQGEIQGEVTNRDRDDANANANANEIMTLDAPPLIHNAIYEVKLCHNQVTQVIKPRKDKLKPNSRKLIEVIAQLQSRSCDV